MITNNALLMYLFYHNIAYTKAHLAELYRLYEFVELRLVEVFVQVLPTVELPGDGESDDLFSVMSNLIVYGGRLTVLSLGMATAISVGWQMLRGFQAARANNEWGNFGVTVMIGALVLLMAVGAGQLAWSYLDSIAELS